MRGTQGTIAKIEKGILAGSLILCAWRVCGLARSCMLRLLKDGRRSPVTARQRAKPSESHFGYSCGKKHRSGAKNSSRTMLLYAFLRISGRYGASAQAPIPGLRSCCPEACRPSSASPASGLRCPCESPFPRIRHKRRRSALDRPDEIVSVRPSPSPPSLG